MRARREPGLEQEYKSSLERKKVSVIESILEGIKSGRVLYGRVRQDADGLSDSIGGAAAGGHGVRAPGHNDSPAGTGDRVFGQSAPNELRLGDNLEFMKDLLRRGYGGKFRLIYIDPPFFTRSSFNASLNVKDSSG